MGCPLVQLAPSRGRHTQHRAISQAGPGISPPPPLWHPNINPHMWAGHPNTNNKAVSLLLVCVNGLDPDKSRKKIGVPGLGTVRGMAGAPRPAGSSRVWGRDGIENPQGASGRHLPSLCSPLQVSQGGSETPVFPAGLTERPPLQSQRLSWRTGARVDARPTCGHQWPETPQEGRQVSRRPHRSMAAQDRAAPTPTHGQLGPSRTECLLSPQVHKLTS